MIGTHRVTAERGDPDRGMTLGELRAFVTACDAAGLVDDAEIGSRSGFGKGGAGLSKIVRMSAEGHVTRDGGRPA